MAANKSSRYVRLFVLITTSQWLVSFGHQRDESVSKQPWGPWMGNRPQPIPGQRPYPDRNGRGGHGGGGVRISGGGSSGGRSGDSEKECICNCNCNCQHSECNNGGSSGPGGGSGGGGGGGSGGGGGGGGSGGWGGRGGRGTICLPLPPMNCDGKNCFFENGANVGTGNNTFDVPHFGAGGGRNPNGDSDKSPQGINATDATHN